MSARDNKVLVRRVFDEIWNERRLDLIDHLYAPGVISHDPASPDFGTGIEVEKQIVTMFHASFPDARFAVEDVIAEDDKVVTRWTMRGTHTGTLGEFRPTDRSVEVTGITIHRVRDDKVVESWANWDTHNLFEQLGTRPPPAQPGQ